MLILLIILLLVFGFGGCRRGPGVGYCGGGGISLIILIVIMLVLLRVSGAALKAKNGDCPQKRSLDPSPEEQDSNLQIITVGANCTGFLG